MVVAFHAGIGVPGGFSGVDVFFVISGFVITGTLVRELERDGRIDLPRFYARRVKRLLPALAAMLTFVALAGILLDPVAATRVAALTGVFASFFTANLYLWKLPTGYFDFSTQLNPLLHTWTLAVEEQFYLVFPVVLLVAWRLRGRWLAFVAVAAISCGSLVVASHWHGTGFGYYGSPARAWEFGVGCLIALAAPALKSLPAIAGSALAAVGLVAVGVTALATTGEESLVTVAVVPVAGACLLIAAGFAADNSISRLLATRPLVAVGDLSYSLYLWHWPLIVFAQALFPASGAAPKVGAALSFVPAWASYRWLENPVRRSPRVRGRAVLVLAAVCIALPVAASGALAAARTHLPSSPTLVLHADEVRGCDALAPYGSASRPADCTWRVPDARGTVVLIGDSNAGQFTEPVTAAANQDGYNATVATLSACAFAQVQLHFHLRQGRSCAAFNRGSLTNLIRARPALVIIAARTDWYLYEKGFPVQASLTSIDGTRWTREIAAKKALFTAGLRSEISALNSANVPVLVVHPIPVLPVNGQACSTLGLLLNRCRATLSRADAVEELRAAFRVEEEAVAGQAAASTLDLTSNLCTTSCSSRRPSGGTVMYLDPDHLSVPGALTLTPRFAEAIRARARPKD
jgi:peptidoglycan/LPS O-acetylase OafA/YrhL